MQTKIKLTKGKSAVVDAEDFNWLNCYSWYFHKNGYAMTGTRKGYKTIQRRMHRMIMKKHGFIYKKGQETDHLNRDKLDNRKCNLRICTRSQNNFNQGVRKDSKSGIRGVSFYRNRWRARIKIGSKYRTLGYFEKATSARKEYQKYLAQVI